jgi:hypothetical protein
MPAPDHNLSVSLLHTVGPCGAPTIETGALAKRYGGARDRFG